MDQARACGVLPYMRLRWPVEKHMPNRDRAVRFVESPTCCAEPEQGSSSQRHRSPMVNSTVVARSERDTLVQLTTYPFFSLSTSSSADCGEGYGRASNIIEGFLEFLLRNARLCLQEATRRTRIQRLAKHLNMLRRVCILDLLSKTEVMDLSARNWLASLNRRPVAPNREMQMRICSSQERSRIMSRSESRKTPRLNAIHRNPEETQNHGLAAQRKASGQPDFVIRAARVAVFIKTATSGMEIQRDFGFALESRLLDEQKYFPNRRRDRTRQPAAESLGWKDLRFWQSSLRMKRPLRLDYGEFFVRRS